MEVFFKKAFIETTRIINKSLYDSLRNQFECSKCSYILYDPVVCSRCSYAYCKECLVESFTQCRFSCSNKSCNESKSSVDIEIKPVTGRLKHFLDELKIKCKYNCQVGLTDYVQHLKDCEISHKDDINCWNCKNVTKPHLLKYQKEEKLKLIQERNLDYINECVKDIKETECYNMEIEGCREILKLKCELEGYHKKVQSIEAKIQYQKDLNTMINRLKRELEKQDDIEELKQQLSLLLKEKSLIYRNLEDFKTKQRNWIMSKEKLEHSLEEKKEIILLQEIKEKTLKGHSMNVYCLILLNLTHIASGSRDCSIMVWDLLSSKCIKTLNGHSSSIWSLEKINESQIASVSMDNTIKIWDLNTSTCIKTLVGHLSMMRCLIKISDCLIASGSDDKTIKIWDINSGLCLRTLVGHLSYIYSLAYLEKNLLMSGGDDNKIMIWDLETYNLSKVLEGHEDGVWSLTVFNENHVVSGSSDKSVKIWDIESSNCVKTFTGHQERVYCVIKLNEFQIVSGSRDCSIKIWDVYTSTCSKTLVQHTNYVRSLIKLSDSQLISASDDNSIKIWRIY